MRKWYAPHVPRAISPQVLQCQWFALSTSGTRRACAGAAPSTHGADKGAQSQNANAVSGVLSEPCAIHMGPPPDQHRTASGPPPDTDATDLHKAWDCRPANAGPLPFVPIGADVRKAPANASHKPHPGDIRATPRPYTRHRLRSTEQPQGHTKATPRLPQGYPKATPRPPQGYPKATPRLPQGYIKATPKPPSSFLRSLPKHGRGWAGCGRGGPVVIGGGDHVEDDLTAAY